MRTVWQTVTRSVTKIKTASFIAALTASLLLPALADPNIAHATGGINNTRGDAWGTLEVAGSGWLGGAGVAIYSNGSQVSYTPNKPNNTVNGVVSGEEWQCVELVNRLYLTKGWTTANWPGNGGQLYDNALTGLTKELNGSITYLNPGDTLVLQDSGAGHAAIINTYNGSTGAIQIASQNTNVVYDSTFSLSNKTLSSTGWGTYSIKGVVHHQSGSTSSSAIVPQSISYSGNLNLFTTGGDGQVYTQYWNGSSWSGYASIGGSMLSNPALIVNGSGLDVFARDVDNQVYTKYWNGSSWSGWSSLGSTTMQGNPTVIHYGSTEIDVFALGTDGHTYKDTYNGSSWGGWSSLGNTMAGSPSAIQYGSEMDVIIRGGDNHVYKDAWNGSSWTGFSSLGGTIIGDPSAMSYSTYGEYDIWADTSGGDVFRKTWNGSSWVDWTDYGGTFTGNPYAVQYGNDMYVFARAKGDNTIWKKYWSYSGGSWNGWSQLGTTTMAGDPSAYQYGTSELDTFVTGSDTKTYKDTYNGSSWGGFSSMN